MRNSLKVAYSALVILIVVSYVMGFSLKDGVLRDAALSLGAGFLGTLLTTIFIDRVVAQREAERSERYRDIVRSKLKRSLATHVRLWTHLFKACSPQGVQHLPRKLSDFADSKAIEVFMYLDGESVAPCYPPATWREHLFANTTAFANELDEVIARFAHVLEPEEIQRVHDCSESAFLYVWHSSHRHFGRIGQFPRAALSMTNTEAGNANVTMHGLREYLLAVSKLIEWVAETQGGLPVPQEIFANEIPAFGSGRLPFDG